MRIIMNEVTSIRDLLSRSFATIKTDPVSGEREMTAVVTGQHFLAQFEVDKLVEAIRKTIANQPQE